MIIYSIYFRAVQTPPSHQPAAGVAVHPDSHTCFFITDHNPLLYKLLSIQITETKPNHNQTKTKT